MPNDTLEQLSEFLQTSTERYLTEALHEYVQAIQSHGNDTRPAADIAKEIVRRMGDAFSVRFPSGSGYHVEMHTKQSKVFSGSRNPIDLEEWSISELREGKEMMRRIANDINRAAVKEI